MRPKPTTVLPLLCCAALSSGCAAPTLEVRRIAPSAPEALLSCPARPETPPAERTTQRDIALFVLALDAAHADCRSKLGRLADWLRAAADPPAP